MKVSRPGGVWLLAPVIIATGILLLFAWLAAQAAVETPAEPALVRVEIRGPQDLLLFTRLEIPVYDHASEGDGGEYLLTELDPIQQDDLIAKGLNVRVLDSPSFGNQYYRITASKPEALELANDVVDVIESRAGASLIQASPEVAARLVNLGIELEGLNLHPLVIPQEVSNTESISLTVDTDIAGMIRQVLTSTIYSLTGDLTGERGTDISGKPYTITNRYTFYSVPANEVPPIKKAAEYIYQEFDGLALSPEYHMWESISYPVITYPSENYPNVIGTITGTQRPEDIFMITAHLDDAPLYEYVEGTSSIIKFAPGADDNASGTVGVLVAAQILSQYEWDCTLRFATFTGEEQGMLGSSAYAKQAYAQEENILAVLNLDMIAYNSKNIPTPDIDLHTHTTQDQVIANLFIDVISSYGLDLVPEIIQPGTGASDHAAFWAYGYPAILAIEDRNDFNPFYHSRNDTLDKLDMDYYTEFVKAAVGTLAHMGCLAGTEGGLAGYATDLGSGLPIEGARVSAYNRFGQEWQTFTGPDGSYVLNPTRDFYTVSGEAADFVTATITNVQITQGFTTTLNLTLSPMHYLYFPLVPHKTE